eukprot:CAMPEP_0196582258 /NCGR_PEP_ID=MMETSP1081-20130531/38296_1 /TAXON_ID=36882 /ORGANISM="Pyramimonas amylifera, Strain CCMP720" /LENGTH=204 /DNA_ID=CAMNT_0041902767 /DNA_START=63 /DNA_END=677 /DNA_ORIENTATION=+
MDYLLAKQHAQPQGLHLVKNPPSHPWHDLHIGQDSPNTVNVLIEVPQYSKVKYELDRASGMVKVAQVFMSSSVFPHNYGFIPRTKVSFEVDKPLPIMVMMQAAVVPLCFLRAKVIGLIKISDDGERDDKIIAVCADDPEFKDYNDISELPGHRIAEIRNFFADYKKLEGKVVTVEDIEGCESGIRAVKAGMDNYTAMVVQDLQS